MYLKLKLKNVDLEKQLLAHKEVEVQLFKERTEMKRAIEKLERDLEISLKNGNKLSRLEKRVKCLQDSYELELADIILKENIQRKLSESEEEHIDAYSLQLVGILPTVIKNLLED